MINLRCTKKLLTQLHITEFEEEDVSTNILGAWYANCFFVDRKPFVIFVNEKTVLSVVIPLKDTFNLHIRFLIALKELLMKIGIPEEVIYAELNEMNVIKYGHTKNGSTVAHMNNLIYKVFDWLSIPKEVEVPYLNMYLAENLTGPEPYRVPKEEVEKILMKAAELRKQGHQIISGQ
jgi:hypothetical protein